MADQHRSRPLPSPSRTDPDVSSWPVREYVATRQGSVRDQCRPNWVGAATGLPYLVITISSPRSTRSNKEPNVFFAWEAPISSILISA